MILRYLIIRWTILEIASLLPLCGQQYPHEIYISGMYQHIFSSKPKIYKDIDCEFINLTSSANLSAAQSTAAGRVCPLRLLLSNMIYAEDGR